MSVQRYSFTLRSDFGEYQVGELRVTPDGNLVDASAMDALLRQFEDLKAAYRALQRETKP